MDSAARKPLISATVIKAVSILSVLLAVVITIYFGGKTPQSSMITRTVGVEPASGLVATARFRRIGADVFVELRNFPSFRSLFKEPVISRNRDGSVTVSLASSSSGFFSNKSEQLTHISLKLPAGNIPPGSRIFFYSEDYDRVFVSAVAP